jgi:hypothetical protein
MRRLFAWIALAAVVLGFANFLWVFVESATIGDALQGRVQDGHYLLVNKGVATEVSREAWEWSRFHASSVLLTHPLAIAAGIYLLLSSWPQIAGVSLAGSADRVERIRASGEVLATDRIGARIGPIQFTAPLVRAEVRPGGVLLQVVGSRPIGIETRSIVKVAVDEGRFSGGWMRIAHDEAGLPANIQLYVAIDHPLTAAIATLATSSVTDRDRHADVLSSSQLEPYPLIIRVAVVLGLTFTLVLIGVGITVVIPRLGPVGWIWTIGLILIAGANVYRFLIRDHERW